VCSGGPPFFLPRSASFFSHRINFSFGPPGAGRSRCRRGGHRKLPNFFSPYRKPPPGTGDPLSATGVQRKHPDRARSTRSRLLFSRTTATIFFFFSRRFYRPNPFCVSGGSSLGTRWTEDSDTLEGSFPPPPVVPSTLMPTLHPGFPPAALVCRPRYFLDLGGFFARPLVQKSLPLCSPANPLFHSLVHVSLGSPRPYPHFFTSFFFFCSNPFFFFRFPLGMIPLSDRAAAASSSVFGACFYCGPIGRPFVQFSPPEFLFFTIFSLFPFCGLDKGVKPQPLSEMELRRSFHQAYRVVLPSPLSDSPPSFFF